MTEKRSPYYEHPEGDAESPFPPQRRPELPKDILMLKLTLKHDESRKRKALTREHRTKIGESQRKRWEQIKQKAEAEETARLIFSIGKTPLEP